MFLADTHSDTLFSLGVGKRTFAQTDITPDRLRQGGVSLQTLALWSGPKGPNGDYEAVADAEYAAIRHFTDAGIRQVDDPEDVKPGENTFMLSFEGCEVFQKSDEMVAFWRQRGIRIGALVESPERFRHPCRRGRGNAHDPRRHPHCPRDAASEHQRGRVAPERSRILGLVRQG